MNKPMLPVWANLTSPAPDSCGATSTDVSSSTISLLLARIETLRAENKRLKHLATTDPVTGIPNRHAMECRLARLAEGEPRVEAQALCLADFDDFKAYNDHYGHLQGDRALGILAHTIAAHLPTPDDQVYRAGGDEFCFVFNAASRARAQRVVAAVRGALHTLRLPHAAGKKSIVTASFGCSWLPGHASVDDRRATLLTRADAALYRAKDAGRDQISMA